MENAECIGQKVKADVFHDLLLFPGACGFFLGIMAIVFGVFVGTSEIYRVNSSLSVWLFWVTLLSVATIVSGNFLMHCLRYAEEKCILPIFILMVFVGSIICLVYVTLPFK